MLNIMYPYPVPVIAGILAMIVAGGGEFNEYLVVKKSDRARDRIDRVYMKDVLDGDTFVLDSGETVRLAEVNAPEVGECYADEAKKELVKVLSGKPLKLVLDEEGKDKFGRLLRIVMIPKKDPSDGYVTVQEYMALRGLVDFSPHGNRAYHEGIQKAVTYARAKGHGMWLHCKKEMQEKDARNAWWVDEHVEPTDKTCTIKGNISDSGHGAQFFLEGCKNYGSIKITPSKGEKYFCTEKEARKAGFKKSANCGRE